MNNDNEDSFDDMSDGEWERHLERERNNEEYHRRFSGTKRDLTKSGKRLFRERPPHGTCEKPLDKSEKRREKKNRKNKRVAAKGSTRKKARSNET